MRRLRSLSFLLLAIAGSALVASPLNEWAYRQELVVPAPGLLKLNLAADTLDAARPDLADLRLLDPAGQETPLLVEWPRLPQAVARAANVRTSLEDQRTVVLIETGLNVIVDGLEVRTAAGAFIKSVRVEGAEQPDAWQTLVTNHPFFNGPRSSPSGRIALPPGRWRWLRFTIDDRRAEAVPILGATVFGREDDLAVPTPVPLRVTSRDEIPGETRLTFALPGRNQFVAALALATPEPLFDRPVRLVYREFAENAIRETLLVRGRIFRAADPALTAREQLTVPVERTVAARELILIVENGDSPPLALGEVRALARPVRLVFAASVAGSYTLASGHRRAAAPRYDLAGFAGDLRGVAPATLTTGPLTANPGYQPAEPLPDIPLDGAALDVAPWAYRKPVVPSAAGVQQLTLDLDVLARAQRDFGDLRLMRGDRQVPYVLEHTALTQALTATVTAAPDPKRPSVSRWKLTVPQARLPLTRLTATVTTTLFQRELQLYEEVETQRSEVARHWLGNATWVRRPGSGGVLTLPLNTAPSTDTFFLETDNGDNPPLALGRVELHYPVTRVLCKTADAQSFELYYGNAQASSPRYDLSLVGAQLLAAEATKPALGPEESLQNRTLVRLIAFTGRGGVLFWCALAAVVLVLLVVIARLLPKPPPPAAGA
ncbi:MAG: DUF3999 family protein [Opitutae bacterium]|nr:DUF3999 family protein [Opitutae bacterium]